MEEQTVKPDSPVVQYIKQQVYVKNNSFSMIFAGPTGSGKTYAALSLAKKIDPTFTIDRVAFKAIDFMKIVNELCNQEENYTRGKVILWDELGVEHNAREFMTLTNRMINFFFQTARHRNLIMIMTVPYLSYVDGATRKLCHAVAEMVYINTHIHKSVVKLKFIQVNVITGKEYLKYFRYSSDGHTIVCKKLAIDMPEPEIYNPYEVRKTKYTGEMYKNILGKLEAKENKEDKAFKKPLTEFQSQVLKLLEGGMTSRNEIADKLSVSASKVSENIKWMRNKGYKVDF